MKGWPSKVNQTKQICQSPFFEILLVIDLREDTSVT